jgi:hypothetical protein
MLEAEGEETAMQRTNRWMAVVLTIAGLHLSACTQKSAGAASKDHDDDDDGPAKIEHVQDTDLSRVILTAKAAKRLDIRTVLAREAQVARSASQRKVVPYAAVLYDAQGDTWVYTSPEPQVFVRHRISVDYIDGDQAVLSEGPPLGTAVVMVGAVELFGTEFEIGH